MDQLKRKTITLLQSHIDHGNKVTGGNLSLYIRTIIDRDIGEHRARYYDQPVPKLEEVKQNKNQAKSLVWNFPKKQ